MISVPLIGQVRVAGRMPVEISKEISKRLEPFINSPHVMTVVDESHIRIVVAGEVARPGTQVVDGPVDLLTVVANAGGLTQFAGETDIFVLRTFPTGTYRIRFRWEDVSRGQGRAARFRLRDNDQVVVE
jgi:polysaccharide export outer membrane protein